MMLVKEYFLYQVFSFCYRIMTSWLYDDDDDDDDGDDDDSDYENNDGDEECGDD